MESSLTRGASSTKKIQKRRTHIKHTANKKEKKHNKKSPPPSCKVTNPQTVPLPKARGVNDNERAEFLIAANRLKAQMTLFAEAATLASSNVF